MSRLCLCPLRANNLLTVVDDAALVSHRWRSPAIAVLRGKTQLTGLSLERLLAPGWAGLVLLLSAPRPAQVHPRAMSTRRCLTTSAAEFFTLDATTNSTGAVPTALLPQASAALAHNS
jgi:hypothetical protein